MWKIRIIDTVASGERAKMTPSCADAKFVSKGNGCAEKFTNRNPERAGKDERKQSVHFGAWLDR